MDHRKKAPVLWTSYVDGKAFRKLGDDEDLSGAQAYERVKEELETLPDHVSLTKEYCDPAKWSGILHMDGKHVKILEIKPGKGRLNRRTAPWIWGVDFLSHDFPLGQLSQAEDLPAFRTYFQTLKELNYPLKIVVCDDVSALKIALFEFFPNALTQLCHTHYFENIRRVLRLRTDRTYEHFFHSLRKHVFRLPEDHEGREVGLAHVFHKYAKGNPLLEGILEHVREHEDLLFAYQKIPNAPATNNFIENFNSHVNGRLESLKGFQTFHSARVFLNAWMIRRRTFPYTGCEGPFTSCNGKMPLQLTLRDSISFPKIPGISAPKTER